MEEGNLYLHATGKVRTAWVRTELKKVGTSAGSEGDGVDELNL